MCFAVVTLADEILRLVDMRSIAIWTRGYQIAAERVTLSRVRQRREVGPLRPRRWSISHSRGCSAYFVRWGRPAALRSSLKWAPHSKRAMCIRFSARISGNSFVVSSTVCLTTGMSPLCRDGAMPARGSCGYCGKFGATWGGTWISPWTRIGLGIIDHIRKN